ncbi:MULTISPECIES: hypothetical protein [unclassified Corynebacterium]|nr:MULTISPECIES: hypothetical protein [unclassified Corynebacterium]
MRYSDFALLALTVAFFIFLEIPWWGYSIITGGALSAITQTIISKKR